MRCALRCSIRFFIVILLLSFNSKIFALPGSFVYLKNVDPSIIQEMRYASYNNFTGRPVKGYEAPECILTKQAALALARVQSQLRRKSMSLKVYDCYRPQMAVDDFIAWSMDADDQKMKPFYYPHVNKENIFKLGYVAEYSAHTRGSAVDLTIVRLSSNNTKQAVELPMGTHFDYMDPLSYPLSANIHGAVRYNRLLLRSYMQQAGFRPYNKEWWHFTLNHEPFPHTYFNFPVE